MEKTNEQKNAKRYLVRWEPFFGILYDRCEKNYHFIPLDEVKNWLSRPDADFIDYHALEIGGPRTAYGAPLLLFLDITTCCQCRCWFCYNRSGEEPQIGEMTSEEICKLIQRFAELGGVELRLSGGEPTLHPDLPVFIELAGQLALRTILVSNGMIAPEVLKYLVKSPVAAYYLSLQGDKTTHDAIRGAGSYAQCLHSAATLRAYGRKVRLSMTYHKRNKQFLEDIVKVADDLDVSVAFNPLRPFGRATLADMLDPSENRMLVAQVVALQRRYPRVWIDTPWSYLSGPPVSPTAGTPKRIGCGGNGLSISVTGDCFSCGQLSTQPKFCLGNARQEDLYTIWLRSRLTCQLANAPLASKCQSCSYLTGSPCFGGCAATALAARGSLSAGDPYCFVDLLGEAS